ncbi:MAG: HK97 gp10 family phage protein [Clostridiales bacterium]|nr:HK97 gp10 family phage protein [Clostridiales bacterium]
MGASHKLTFGVAICAEVAARLLAKVINRTPVGKMPIDRKEMNKTEKVVGASGKSRTFLTAEAAALQERYKHWQGYKGGTLRRGWTGGKKVSAKEFAETMLVAKSGNTYTIEVINPVKYTPYVEFGHRQKPRRYVPAIGKQLSKGG